MDIEEEFEIVDNFSSKDDEDSAESEEENSNYSDIIDRTYNASIYNFNYIYTYFIKYEIMIAGFKCPICNCNMNKVKEITFLDRECFRCKKSNPSHDIKINLRKNSIFEEIKMNLISIFFIIYECFLNNISANKAKLEFSEFKKHIDVPDISKNNINKLYSKLRNVIKLRMHETWKKEPLCYNIDGEIPRVEIDESKLIANQEKTYWMFGIIERKSKNCRVFTVLDNRTRQTLIPIILNNVYTINDLSEYHNNQDIHLYSLSTRVYSDCWRAYNEIDFKNNGFILHRVNHSVWFGSGLFHTNTIEGLWSQIKRLCKDFAGINFKLLNKIANKGISEKDYLDDWICWGLFLRNIELKKLNKLNKIIELNKLLKIIK